MNKIIDGKLYDTNTAELLATKVTPGYAGFSSKLKGMRGRWIPARKTEIEKLYITQNGAFFFVANDEGEEDRTRWFTTNAATARSFCASHGAGEIYVKYFGNVEVG